MSDALTRKAIVDLRERHAGGESALSLSRSSGLSRRQIDAILRGRLFPELPGPLAPPPRSLRTIENMTILAVAIAEKRDRAVTAFRVAELIGIERGVARKRVERMADRGLVTRSPTGLRLTRKGWALVRKIGAESKQEKDKKQ